MMILFADTVAVKLNITHRLNGTTCDECIASFVDSFGSVSFTI